MSRGERAGIKEKPTKESKAHSSQEGGRQKATLFQSQRWEDFPETLGS